MRRRRYVYKDYEIDVFRYESLDTRAATAEAAFPGQTGRVSVAAYAQTGFETEAYAEKAAIKWAEDEVGNRLT